MPLAFQDVPRPFVGSLDESSEPKLLEDGYTVVENGWYDKQGRISKRQGLVPFITSGIGAEEGNRLAAYGDQILATTDTSSLYAARDVDGRWLLQDLIPEATVRRLTIRREIDQSMTQCDMAIAGNYTVYTWIRDPNADCYYRIVETASGTVVTEGFANSLAANVSFPRLATNGTNVLLTYIDAPNNDIYARRIACGSNPPTVGTETALIADLNTAGPYYDICSMGTGWALFYRNTTPEAIARQVVSANPPTLGWTRALGFDATFEACIEVGTTLFIGYFTTDIAYQVLVSSTGAVSLGHSLLETTPTQAGPIGIAAVSTTAAMFSWKSDAELQKWRTATNVGGLGSVHDTYRVIAESKPFPITIGGNDLGVYQWFSTGPAPQSVLVLCFLDRTVGQAQIDLRPVATAAFGSAAQSAGVRVYLANPAVFSSSEVRIAVRVEITPGSSLLGADEVRANFADRRRHQAVRFGTALYLSGGIVTQWDGKQATELAYIQSPKITSSTSSAAGGTMANGAYQMVAVYEEYDDNGDVHRSIASPIKPHTLAGADTRIILTVEPLTLTLRQDDAQRDPGVELAVYVTEPNLDVFYRYAAIGSAATNLFVAATGLPTAAVTINIDSVPTSNPTLYTTGGILENDSIYGGATILCEHKSRLWAAGGEDAEVIWYSQPRVDGEPAEFNLAQQIRIPGQEVTGLASLDDVLVVFTKKGIFCIHGEGPNSLGDISSGSFSDPIQLPVDTGARTAGAEENHCIASCPQGVVFPSFRGICLLDRSRSVQFIGAAVEDSVGEITSDFPVLRSATLVPTEGHVRWVAHNSNGTESTLAVWDYILGRWALWPYLITAPDSGVVVDSAIVSANGIDFFCVLAEDSRGYLEFPGVFTDDSEWYGVTIETGWMSFAAPFVYKRLRRIGVQINRDGTGGLTVEIARDGGAYVTRTFTEAEITALDQDAARVHVSEQKGHRFRVRLKETEPAVPDQGLGFVGLTFNVGQKGREARVEATASK